MKAIRVEATGGPEVLKLQEIELPDPGKDQVLVAHKAIGLNFIDVYHRTGLYPLPLPFTPGSEGAGVVEKVGEGVQSLKPGDRVAYAGTPGAYAEKAIVPASKLVRIPDSISFEDAAGILLQGMTVHYLARSTFPIEKGKRVLIHAAAGGVGRMLVQAAKHLGAFVIATVSTPEKAELARKAGADEVIRYTIQDFAAEAKRVTNGAGVDAVYDSVGQSTFEGSLNCLRPRGLLVLFGQSSGPVPPVNLQIFSQKGSLYLTRPSLGHYILTRQELDQRAEELFDWLSKGVVTLRIDSRFPLFDAAEAHRRIESRASSGKILLIP